MLYVLHKLSLLIDQFFTPFISYLLCPRLVRRWRLFFFHSLTLLFLFLLNILLCSLCFIRGKIITIQCSNYNRWLSGSSDSSSPYRLLWNVQTLGKTWQAAWFWGSLQSTPLPRHKPPEGRQTQQMYVFKHVIRCSAVCVCVLSELPANLCCLAVFDQRFKLLAVCFDELLQHGAVILHQELLFGHLHSPF